MTPLYNLRLYMRVDHELVLIDEVVSRDLEELQIEAKARKELNDLYVPIILEFKRANAIII